MSTHQNDKSLSLHINDNEEKEEKLSIQEKMQALRIGWEEICPADERAEPKGALQNADKWVRKLKRQCDSLTLKSKCTRND